MRAHHGNVGQSATSTSMFNLLIPVYIILMGSFFLYVAINLFLNPKDSEKKKKCADCYRFKRSKSNTQGTGQTRRTKASNIYETLPTYRAINQHGSDNGKTCFGVVWVVVTLFVMILVRQTLRSLITDMQTLRTHLAKAEACRCQLRKYKLAQAAAMRCMKEMENNKENNDEKKDIEGNKTEVSLLEKACHQGIEPGMKNPEEMIIEENKAIENVEDLEDKNQMTKDSSDDFKENKILSLATNKKKKTKMGKLKQRLNVVKYLRQHSNIEIYEDENNVGIELDNTKKMLWSKDMLNKFNREFDRLVGHEKPTKSKTKKEKSD